MKLLTFETENETRCGVLQEDRVVDVTSLLNVDQPLRDVRELLELGDSPIEQTTDRLPVCFTNSIE